MDFNRELNRITDGVMDLFFPRRCPFCGGLTGGELVCGACRTSLPYCDAVRQGADFGRCTAPLY